jgi:hypothetical protein
MRILRPIPLKTSPQRRQPLGLCSACTSQIARTDEFVLLYGEAFHRDCAFYRSRNKSDLDRSRASG